MIELLVYAPREDFARQGTTGFDYSSQLLSAYRWHDNITQNQDISASLRRTLFYLQHRYPQRIRIHWVDPWSLSGLWIAFRYRLRGFPSVLINRETVLRGEEIKLLLEQQVVEILSTPSNHA